MPTRPDLPPAGTTTAATGHPSTAAPESTYDRIVDACEALIRRHGPAKATVVDVARALGMSHANVYHHVSSKAALREAVVGRWLRAVEAELADAAPAGVPAPERIAGWLRALAAAKRSRLLDDPELFATYAALGDEQKGEVARHMDVLVTQLAGMIADGVRAGELGDQDPRTTARAVVDATSAFHNPHRVPETARDPDGLRRLDAVVALVVAGLRGRRSSE